MTIHIIHCGDLNVAHKEADIFDTENLTKAYLLFELLNIFKNVLQNYSS